MIALLLAAAIATPTPWKPALSFQAMAATNRTLTMPKSGDDVSEACARRLVDVWLVSQKDKNMTSPAGKRAFERAWLACPELGRRARR